MTRKTVVVGAGLSGITAAYFEARKGGEVVLLESDSRPGGLLNSDFNAGHYFDYGTHIFSDTGEEQLDQFLFSDLNESNSTVTKTIATANYFQGMMNNKNSYVDTSVLPEEDFNRGCMELLSAMENTKAENLREYLKSRIGGTLYNLIFKDVIKKYMGIDAQDLSTKAGALFDMTRVLAFDDATTKRLCKIDMYDARLGHHKKEEGVIKYYPKKGGAGKVIELLMGKLQQSGVFFKPSTKISAVVEKQGKCQKIVTDSETFKFDKLLWTLPASFLIRLAGLNQFAPLPQFRNTGLYDFVFTEPLNSNATFINIYDTKLLSGRVTLYQNLTQSNNYNCTVEVLADNDVDLSVQTDLILRELVEMKLMGGLGCCKFRQFRKVKNGFPVLTTDFVSSQNKLQKFCESYFCNVEFVGRSAKVFFMPEILRDVYEKVAKDKD